MWLQQLWPPRTTLWLQPAVACQYLWRPCGEEAEAELQVPLWVLCCAVRSACHAATQPGGVLRATPVLHCTVLHWSGGGLQDLGSAAAALQLHVPVGFPSVGWVATACGCRAAQANHECMCA
jgi:hypothetical protein